MRDPRLRPVDTKALRPGTKYQTIARVVGRDGTDFGDAAGLLTLPSGGRILYVWSGLTRDETVGPAFTRAILGFAAR
jgi:hypothetical protein